MKAIAIIPARGGSIGIRLKNIQPLNGKPLIAYSIEAARGSKYIDRVVVSTDHPQIAEAALQYKAEVINRPADISGDSASSESALIHVLEILKQKEGYSADLTVFLQCTSPLTSTEDIDETIETLLRENGDTALAVAPFHYYLWNYDSQGNAIGINHDKKIRLMRQQQNKQYLETGAIYVMQTDKFLDKKHRFFGKTVLSPIPSERTLEIDEPNDLDIASFLIKKNHTKTKINLLPDEIEAIFFDFDGVFTTNKVFVNQKGIESVVCDRSDGLGLAELKMYNIKIAVLSTEKNKVVESRCQKLDIECHQALENKADHLNLLIEKFDINRKNCIFVGNDINDAECLKIAGCSIVPRDAHDDVKNLADLILDKKGGQGAVRELCDLIKVKKEGINNG